LSTRKISRIGASAVLVGATIASAFVPVAAASAAPTTGINAFSTAPFVVRSDSSKPLSAFHLNATSLTISSQHYDTYSEAVKNASTDWSLPGLGDTGQITGPSNRCLYAGSPIELGIRLLAIATSCSNVPTGSITQFSVNASGVLSVNDNGKMLGFASGPGGSARVYPGYAGQPLYGPKWNTGVSSLKVTSQRAIGPGTIRVTGTATPNGEIRYGSQRTTVSGTGTSGNFTFDITRLPADTKSLKLEQYVLSDRFTKYDETTVTLTAPVPRALTALVDSTDPSERTAALSGTATPNAAVSFGTAGATTADADGNWTGTATGLQAGSNTLTITQKISGTTIDSTTLDVVLAAGTFTGTSGPAVTLDREKSTTVSAQASATDAVSNAEGTVTFTAPTGSTFAADQGTITGQISAAAGDYANDERVTLTDGQRSADGTTYTYSWASGTTAFGKDDQIRWGITVNAVKDAAAGEHELSWTAKGTTAGGTFDTSGSTKATIAAVVISSPTVESPEAGSTVDTSRPTFTGHGQKGAKITIGYGAKSIIGTATVNDQGEWTINPTAGLALGESKLIVTQTSGTDVKTLDHTITRVLAEQPLAVTSHTDNQNYTEGVTTFRGTAASGAAIKAVNQWGTVMGSTTADANGNWAFSRNLGPTTDGYDITFTAVKGDKTETQKLHLNYQGVVAFEITSPSNNSVYKPGIVTFRGKAAPNTTVKAVNQWGTVMGTATSNLDSDWTFSRNLGPTADGYDITFTATKGDDVQRTVLHLSPEAINVPVAITSIGDGDTYLPGLNVLKGTGTPGAKVSAVNALNGWNVAMGTATVDENGDWALPERNWGPSNDYQIKVTQTNPDKTTSTATVNIKAPVFTALTVDGFTLGNPNGAGVFATFTGKASPGATIAVKSAVSGSTYQTVTATSDGTWSATRTWDPSYTYKLAFEQKTIDGKTDSVAYGSFTAKNTK
jgi:hypothetical protein